jgi:hypothetical protein
MLCMLFDAIRDATQCYKGIASQNPSNHPPLTLVTLLLSRFAGVTCNCLLSFRSPRGIFGALQDTCSRNRRSFVLLQVEDLSPRTLLPVCLHQLSNHFIVVITSLIWQAGTRAGPRIFATALGGPESVGSKGERERDRNIIVRVTSRAKQAHRGKHT